MKNQNLSDINLEELKQKEKTIKIVNGVFLGILTVLLLFVIILFIQKQYTIAFPLLIVFFSSFLILTICWKELKNIKKEIESRNIYI